MKYEKNYTRDTSLVIQQVWAQEFSFGFAEKLGLNNPNRPTLIHYLNEGSVEIWDNPEATDWLKKELFKIVLQDKDFLKKSLESYFKILEKIKSYWANGRIIEINKLKEYLGDLREGVYLFNVWYYLVTNDEIDEETKKLLLDVRKDDVYFAQNDIFIRESLKAIYPELSGLEIAILVEEVEVPPTPEDLKKRMRGFAIIDGQEKFYGLHSEFNQKYPNLNLTDLVVESNLTEIKGSIAFKGKVTGMVKILRRRERVNEVKEGDIIISPMTTPDFLPAMQKALAFVTDEGGITCHAAIVARELKKPCIIGTKIATKVLKDGDMVEVDADRGIVKIVEK